MVSLFQPAGARIWVRGPVDSRTRYRCREGVARPLDRNDTTERTHQYGQNSWSCPGFVDTPELGRKGASTMPKSHRPYPPEFRARLVELVRKGRTPEELGRQFEPSAQAIRNWVKQAALDAGQRTDGLTTEEREEV